MEELGKSIVCSAGHAFDLSKSGYVNLLPPGKGKNARTGDDRDMVASRAAFLKRGFYNPISDTAADLIAEYAGGESLSLCDMGSGEGWHTCRIAEQITCTTGRETLALGLDASKFAADRASRLAVQSGWMPKAGIGAPWQKKTAVYFVPANLFHTPLAEGVFSAALSLFAPVAWEEAHRIVKDNGLLLVASSGKNHLMEMRQIIYREVHVSEATVTPPETFSGWQKIASHTLSYPIHLPDKMAIISLFMMTPFYYKTTEAGKVSLLSRDELDVTAEVDYTVYRKINSTRI